MTVGEFAASLVKSMEAKATEAPAEETEPTEDLPEEATEAGAEESEAEVATEVAAETDDPKPEEEAVAGEEQPENAAEGEEKEVLSKLNPKTQEKIQRRIDKVIAEKKSAEDRAVALEQRLQELEAKMAHAPAEPDVVAISADDPNDRASSAKSEAELTKLERDAHAILRAYNDNEDAILRAIAREDDTVFIEGNEVKVADIRSWKKTAERHLQSHIPARRKFLVERSQAVNETRKIFPELFDTTKPAYQELQGVLKQYPQLRAVPQLEYFIGFALEGMAARRKAAEAAKPALAKASATPPKAAADSTANASPQKQKQAGGSERQAAQAALEKAEKNFDRSGSSSDYQKVLIAKNKLKSIK